MTRQNVTDGPREILTKRCPTCAGDGIIVSEASTAVDTERRLRALAAQSPRTKAFKVELNAHVASILIGPAAQGLKEIEAATKRVFLLEGKEGAPLDHFNVLDKGTVEKLAPESPYKEGQELDVKLGEVGLHDPEAVAVGASRPAPRPRPRTGRPSPSRRHPARGSMCPIRPWAPNPSPRPLRSLRTTAISRPGSAAPARAADRPNLSRPKRNKR